MQDFIERLKGAAGALTTRQIATLVGAFVLVVLVTIGSAYWLNTPTYGVLFSDMDAESAATVVAKLKADKVAYTLDDGGRTVRVPTDRLDELRLALASQGMPASGRVGFEIFDRTAFGVTDFLEHVNYRRALEGELARTIATIGEVAGARVHIAMPQPSLFAGRDQPTKASVVLKLRSNRQLAPSTVSAITGLVAASVESLRPESVLIIDTFGRPLAKAPDQVTTELGGQQLERQQRIEHDLNTRVVSLLEPIVGTGRVRVNVSAQINHDTAEETEERWDPTPVVRSRQSVNQTGALAAPAVGVAGARTTTPPDPNRPAEQTPAVAAPGSSQHSAETTNYEVSKFTRHLIQPEGQIARLSVAVVVDDNRESPAAPAAPPDPGATPPPASTPRSQEEIQKIHDLVAAAVGLDTARGDQLTVENIAFEDVPVESPAAPSLWQVYAPPAFEIGRIGAVVAVGLFALFGVIRPMVRSSFPLAVPVTTEVAVETGALPRRVQDLENEIDKQLQAAEDVDARARRLPVLTKRLAALTEREPENAARLLRTWLTEDER